MHNMNTDYGRIFSRLRGSMHDGPGMRTVLFFKGCPIRCIWCHNPESQEYGISRTSSGEIPLCERDVKDISLNEALDYCLKDSEFYVATGGGVTLSGGEPLVQIDFVQRLSELLHIQEVHLAIDTCGDVHRRTIERVLPYCNLWLYDLKILDGELYRRYTGGDVSRVLDNLSYIDESSKSEIIIRCPIIPSINDHVSHFKAIGQLVSTCKRVSAISVLPYHSYGFHKYEQLEREYSHKLSSLNSVNIQTAQFWVNEIKKWTCVPVGLQ